MATYDSNQMMPDIALAIVNLNLDFLFKGNLITLTSDDIYQRYIQHFPLFPLTPCHGHSAWLLFFFAWFLSTYKILFSNVAINCQNSLILPQSIYKSHHCKRCGDTLWLCTKISPTKQIVLQKFFRLTLIFVHIIIFFQSRSITFFQFSSQKHHWTAH